MSLVIKPEYVSVDVIRAFATERGIVIEPLTNSIQAAQEGADLRVMGYQLSGPRQNKTTVCLDTEGRVDFDRVKLWWEGVEYGNRRAAEKRARVA